MNSYDLSLIILLFLGLDRIGIDGRIAKKVIMGAITREKVNKIKPEDRTLDLTGLRRREFTEYWELK